ncbi:MAG: cyclic nucleotide-binding domain-containing protein [Spirochaetes bacterium]|nr:cyclic nucleotide-binding domain-containing protein [Spirochaetota bacterium]
MKSQQEKIKQDYSSAAALLERVIPFRFLSTQEKKKLVKALKGYSFNKGDVIYNKGDSEDSVYLIRKGVVETLDYKASGSIRINVITAGHYFGERAALFNQKRIYTVRALSDVSCYSVSGKNFRQLVNSSKAFSKAMSTILRDKQGIFSAFDRFKAEVLQGINRGHIEIRQLIPFYKDMEPAMHKLLSREDEIDTSVLDYAVKRLPSNVTENFVYILTDELYAHIPEPWKLFDPVPAPARRRRSWKMQNGQTMMLYRPGITDLLDLITCLCVFVVEAEKIRKKLSEHRILLAIKNHISRNEFEKDKKKADAVFLKTLPFSPRELAGLKTIWPDDTVKYIYNVAIHSGIFSLVIKKQVDLYNTRRAEMWLSQIGDAVKNLTGYKVSELPEDVNIHVISSNTHSVLNCLNHKLISRIDEVISWGEKTQHQALSQKWFNKYDLLYALSKDYINEKDEDGTLKLDNNDGVIRVERTASTGIQVQLFSLNKLKDKISDPGLPPIPKNSNAIILNIDYAFGQQAEEIMRSLLLQFGQRISSINIIGKAGALVGKRGDILLPDVFIEQSEDLFQSVENKALSTINRLQKRLDGTKIHKGPMLTVDGTLFQNTMMLSFYRHIWDCIGLEMEGIYYLRQIIEGNQHGLIPQNLFTNFFYYVSDLPADPGSQLSTVMELSEEMPPLYAVTREILTDIFLIESGEKFDEESFNN